MKYIRSKKGQGGDTFKLLIAAVVAMVILGIVTGVFNNIWSLVTGITCVSNPINEFVTQIQRAEAGMDTTTGAICMSAGESFSASAFVGKKISNLGTLTFQCDGAAICETGGLMTVTPGSGTDGTISATGSVKFVAIIHCDQSGNGGDYTCNARIRSA